MTPTIRSMFDAPEPQALGSGPKALQRAIDRFTWALGFGLGSCDLAPPSRSAVDLLAGDDEDLQTRLLQAIEEDVNEDGGLTLALTELPPAELGSWLMGQGDVTWWSVSEVFGYSDAWKAHVFGALFNIGQVWPDELT